MSQIKNCTSQMRCSSWFTPNAEQRFDVVSKTPNVSDGLCGEREMVRQTIVGYIEAEQRQLRKKSTSSTVLRGR